MAFAQNVRFYIPIVLLWGSVFLSTLDPVLIQSDIRFDPLIERRDLMRIDPGGNVALDDIVIYRQNRTDLVAQVIGLGGDDITFDFDGRSIIRNGERFVVAPIGYTITTNDSGMVSVEDGQIALYVHNVRRNPFSVVISEDAIRGRVARVYRYSDLGRSEWLTIGFSSLIVLALVVMPFVAFMRQSSPAFFRIVTLVTHTFLTLAVGAALLAMSLPGDPMNIGAEEPIWWWFPLAVVAGFDWELVVVAGLVLAVLWVGVKKPWRGGERPT